MEKQAILARLKENEAALRAKGVTRVALFGSRARNDGRPDSDIDLMIDIAAEAKVGLFEYVAIIQYLEDLFPNHVDVANRSQLKAFVRPNAERDAVYAF